MQSAEISIDLLDDTFRRKARVTATIDTFTGTFKLPNEKALSDLKEFLVATVPGDEVVNNSEGKYGGFESTYYHKFETHHGLIFTWALPQEQKRETDKVIAKVEMKGKFLGLIDAKSKHTTFLELKHRFDVVATRVDPAVDFKDDPTFLEGVIDAYEKGNFTGFKYSGIFNTKKHHKEYGYVDCGETAYFGKLGSKKILRIYDKAKEQGVRGDWVRMEYQARERYAKEVFEKMCEIPLSDFDGDGVAGLVKLAGLVTGAIDFIDRNSNPQPCRADRLEWWRNTLVALPKIICKPDRTAEKTLDRTRDWMKRQVATAAAAVKKAMAPRQWNKFLSEFLKTGEERLTPAYEALIKREKARGFGNPLPAPA